MAKKKDNNEIPKTGTIMDGTVPLTGIVYSKEANLKVLRASDTVHHASASERIIEAVDFRIKNRVYLKLHTGDKQQTKKLDATFVGEGDNAYIAIINGIFDLKKASEEQIQALQEEIANDTKETNEDNKFESALLSLGYTGYLANDVIIVLDTNVKVKKYEEEKVERDELETPEADVEQTKKSLPKPTTKRKLSKKEANVLSSVMPALQAKAPSATIRSGTLIVNDDEYQSFLKEASSFPNMPKFVEEDYNEEQPKLTHETFRAKKLTRQKRKRIEDKELADTIKKILSDESFTKNFSGKISDAFKNFESASKAYQDLETNKEKETSNAETTIEGETKSSETNELLEDIRDILMTLADETVDENAISKEDARERIQDILEKTKNSNDLASLTITNTLNQVLSEIRNNEIEEDLGIKNKEPIRSAPDLKKTTVEEVLDDEPTQEEVEGTIAPKTPKTTPLAPIEPEVKQNTPEPITPSVKKEAKEIVKKHKDSDTTPTQKDLVEIDIVAKELNIETNGDWKKTISDIEKKISEIEQPTLEKIEPKEVQRPDLSKPDLSKPDTQESKPIKQIEQNQETATSTPEKQKPEIVNKKQQSEKTESDVTKPSIEPKEVQRPDLSKPDTQESKTTSTDNVQPKKETSKPAYEMPEDDDWSKPPRRTVDQPQTDKEEQPASDNKPVHKVEPKVNQAPDLTPVEREIQHSKEVGETVPRFKRRQVKTKPVQSPRIVIKNTPRDTYRKEETTVDEKTGNTTTTPSFTPTPSNLSGTDLILGSLINKNKDIVTKDAEGNEISRRPSANKIEYTKRLIRKGDEYLGRGGTSSFLKLFRKKKTVKTSNPDTPEPKQKDPTNLVPEVSQDQKPKTNKVDDKKKYTRVTNDTKLSLNKGMSIFGKTKPVEIKKPTAETVKTDKKPETKKPVVTQAPETQQASLVPPTVEPKEDDSSILSSIADFIPSKRGAGKLLGRAGAFLGKAGKFAGKIAAPIAAGASIVSGIDDINEGNKVESASDIIPKGGLLDKLNPFNYVMNAGRYVGDKWNKGYETVSNAVGGSGSLGSDIFNAFHKDEFASSNTPVKGAKIAPEVSAKPVEQKDLSIKPKLENYQLKPETEQIADAGLNKAASSEQKQSVSAPTNIVSNVTNNSSPTQQILPNNMMAQRNTESAYQSMNNRKFVL